MDADNQTNDQDNTDTVSLAVTNIPSGTLVYIIGETDALGDWDTATKLDGATELEIANGDMFKFWHSKEDFGSTVEKSEVESDVNEKFVWSTDPNFEFDGTITFDFTDIEFNDFN